jgi:cytochrome c553
LVTSKGRFRGQALAHVRTTFTFLVLVAALAAVGVEPARSQDLTRGREIFQLCGQCHGPAGGGNALYHAPAIGGLPAWYVEAQLTKFRDGMRGARAQDKTGLQMRPMTRALTQPGDLKAVAAYVATLKPERSAATLTGDAERGKAAYALCMACHGDRAQGNQGIGAPPLAGQPDWYLVAQLEKFRQGLRGTDPRDPTGAQMRPMAMTLGNEQAIRDVVAYIRTLGH